MNPEITQFDIIQSNSKLQKCITTIKKKTLMLICVVTILVIVVINFTMIGNIY